MLFAGNILTIASVSEFEQWKVKHDSAYRAMPSRGILDVKARLPAVEAAVRLAPNGGFEDLEERQRTGYLRPSRKTSPTARAFQTRIVAAIGIILKFPNSHSADISRAYPKARKYAEEDHK